MKELGGNSFELHEATLFEVNVAPDGRIWVNVDGICTTRIKLAHNVRIDFKGTTILSLTEGVAHVGK